MTIQISVTVWTVICFAALYFILKYLLFRPVLAVMDGRKEKIEKSRSAKRNAMALFEEKLKEVEKENAEAAVLSEQEAKQNADFIRKEGKEKLDIARKERIKTLEKHQSNADEAFDSELAAANDAVGDAATKLLNRIFND